MRNSALAPQVDDPLNFLVRRRRRYCRFFQGRRSPDDERQVGRWAACAGEKGRWRNNLIAKCVAAGRAFDDASVSPVVRQTLQHWAYRLTEADHDAYAKKQESAAKRREKVQEEYVEDFQGAVAEFLRFHQTHALLSQRLARLVATHATPVGSGTVARTKRIPIERRAEAAVIAWMRHQTTAYDSMKIARVKGQRREVRRMLAARSRSVLEAYRQGHTIPDSCPLKRSLETE